LAPATLVHELTHAWQIKHWGKMTYSTEWETATVTGRRRERASANLDDATIEFQLTG